MIKVLSSVMLYSEHIPRHLHQEKPSTVATQSFYRIYVLMIFLAMLLTQNSSAQSRNIRLEMLQGQWMFRSLDATLNFDMEAKTQTFNPWNIHFNIYQDTFVMIKMVDMLSGNRVYDTSVYSIQIDSNQMLFFLPDDERKRKPVYNLQIVSLKNQALVLEDIQGERKKKSLLFTNEKILYTFSRHQDLYQSAMNLQRQLAGTWYGHHNFLEDVLHGKDTLLFTSMPIYYKYELSKNKKCNDTVFRYRLIRIGDENITYKDDSVFIKSCIPEVMYASEGEYPDAYFMVKTPYYFIIPQKKMIEVVIPQETDQKDGFQMPVYEHRSFLFHYQLEKDQLILIKASG